MLAFLVNAIKIIFVLGFLVLIHEGGHFCVAKLCKVKVNEFAIGFGPTLVSRTKGETKYALHAIPLGGYVSMEGEEEHSDAEGSFSNAGALKKIAIVLAGGTVNILFGLLVYFILVVAVGNPIIIAGKATLGLVTTMFAGLKELFTGQVDVNQMMGIVGISDVVVKTSGIADFTYIMAIISLSLGFTNLLPLPPLDGGKVVIYLMEAIRRKPIKEELELKIQTLGFAFIIILSIYVTYNDIIRIL